MKTIYTFLFCFLFFFGYSQKSSSVDVLMGVNTSYRNLVGDEAMTFIIESRDENEKLKVNWNVGLNYNKQLSQNFFLRTGAHLMNMGYRRPLDELQFPNQHNGNGGHDPEIDSEENSVLNITYNYYFVDIPVVARYEFSAANKFSPFLELGVIPSYFAVSKTSVVPNVNLASELILNQIAIANSLQVFGLAAVGMNYDYSENNILFSQVSYKHGFRSIVDAPINEFLYSVGLDFGIRVKF